VNNGTLIPHKNRVSPRQAGVVLLMPVDKVAAQCLEVFIHKRWQHRRLWQASDPIVTHRTMPAPLRRVLIAEILRQSITEAMLGGEQIQHRVDPGNLGALVLHEVPM
jgi:hypothetical protein